MKTSIASIVFLLVTLLCSTAVAATIESVEPVWLDDEISIVDYGFAMARGDSVGGIYGNVLETDEAEEAKTGDPLFYVVFQNATSEPQQAKLYIRGGRQYDCYWSKTIQIPANDIAVFFGSGHDKPSRYGGAWSIEAVGRGIAKLSLTVQ